MQCGWLIKKLSLKVSWVEVSWVEVSWDVDMNKSKPPPPPCHVKLLFFIKLILRLSLFKANHIGNQLSISIVWYHISYLKSSIPFYSIFSFSASCPTCRPVRWIEDLYTPDKFRRWPSRSKDPKSLPPNQLYDFLGLDAVLFCIR